MTPGKVCLPAALCLAVSFGPCAAQSFANHSDNQATSGDNVFYHADFNNDGIEDLVYIDTPVMGTPPGTFDIDFTDSNVNDDEGLHTGPYAYQVPLYQGSTDVIAALALGDFNHDGSIDIAAFARNSGNVYIYLNDGKGNFTLGSTFPYGPSGGTIGSVSATVADFNHDQIFDLAFIVDGRLNVWLGDGKGGFIPGPSQIVFGQNLAMGDFDGDGHADLLVYQDPVAVNTAYVYYGDGIGAFPQFTILSLPSGQATFSAGDVNTDGKSDVMAVDTALSKSHLWVFYGDSSREFASRTTITGGRCLYNLPVQVADLDGNGQNDLIFADYDCDNPESGYVDIRLRNPDSSYNTHQTVYWPYGDFDLSGNTTIVQAPLIWNADGNAQPDILAQACVVGDCTSHWDTTLYNQIGWNSQPCSPPTTVGISVCSPAAGLPLTNSVNFNVGARGYEPMRDVEIWVDGSKRAEQRIGFSYYTYFNGNVTLDPGHHNVTVVAAGWDQSEVKQSFKIDVQ